VGDALQIVAVELVRGEVWLWQIDLEHEKSKERFRCFCSLEDWDAWFRGAVELAIEREDR
jgi:hypothetical protein